MLHTITRQKKGTSLWFLDLSQEVIPLVQNSNHLLEDLRRLNQLKDSSNQNDVDMVNAGPDKTIQSEKSKKLARLKR